MLFSSSSLLTTALLLAHTIWASHVETFSDANCQTPLTDWYGPNNGDCTAVRRNGNWTSFRILNLQQGCAITIYGPDTSNGPCNSQASPGAIVADAGTCYLHSTWAFYSIDGCVNAQTSISTPFTSTQTSLSTSSATSSSTSATSSPPSQKHQSDTNIGAIVGGVIGGVAFGVIVAAVVIVSFIRYHRVKRSRLPDYPGTPGSSHGLNDIAAKELPGGAFYHESWTGSARSYPHELPTESIVEAPSHPVAELDSKHDGAMRPGSAGNALKK